MSTTEQLSLVKNGAPEICANCDRLKSMHWYEGGKLYCSGNPNSTKEFKESSNASHV